jgi:hypothetical protein
MLPVDASPGDSSRKNCLDGAKADGVTVGRSDICERAEWCCDRDVLLAERFEDDAIPVVVIDKVGDQCRSAPTHARDEGRSVLAADIHEKA